MSCAFLSRTLKRNSVSFSSRNINYSLEIVVKEQEIKVLKKIVWIIHSKEWLYICLLICPPLLRCPPQCGVSGKGRKYVGGLIWLLEITSKDFYHLNLGTSWDGPERQKSATSLNGIISELVGLLQ